MQYLMRINEISSQEFHSAVGSPCHKNRKRQEREIKETEMRLFTTTKRLYERLEKEYQNREVAILDVGVGRKKFPRSVGIDIRPHNLADIVHDLNTFPWPIEDERFDLILCRHVMEHLPATDKVMEELCRVCKKGGKVVIEVPHFSYVEAFRHWQHCHFFTSGSFDYFNEGNKNYRAFFRITKKRLLFDDISRVLLIEFLANIFMRVYERHFAFIFPASSLYFELERL